MPMASNPAFEPLMIMHAVPKQLFSGLFSTHPATEQRVERLLALEQELATAA